MLAVHRIMGAKLLDFGQCELERMGKSHSHFDEGPNQGDVEHKIRRSAAIAMEDYGDREHDAR